MKKDFVVDNIAESQSRSRTISSVDSDDAAKCLDTPAMNRCETFLLYRTTSFDKVTGVTALGCGAHGGINTKEDQSYEIVDIVNTSEDTTPVKSDELEVKTSLYELLNRVVSGQVPSKLTVNQCFAEAEVPLAEVVDELIPTAQQEGPVAISEPAIIAVPIAIEGAVGLAVGAAAFGVADVEEFENEQPANARHAVDIRDAFDDEVVVKENEETSTFEAAIIDEDTIVISSTDETTVAISECKIEESTIEEAEEVAAEDATEIDAVAKEATVTEQAVESANDVVSEHGKMIEETKESIGANTMTDNSIMTESVVGEAEIDGDDAKETDTDTVMKSQVSDTLAAKPDATEREITEADGEIGDVAALAQDPVEEMSDSTTIAPAVDTTTKMVDMEDSKVGTKFSDVGLTTVEVIATELVAELKVAAASLSATETPFVEPIAEQDESEDKATRADKVKLAVKTVNVETQTAQPSGVALIAAVEATPAVQLDTEIIAMHVSIDESAIEQCTRSFADDCTVLDATTQTEPVIEMTVDEKITSVKNIPAVPVDDSVDDSLPTKDAPDPIQLEDIVLEFMVDDGNFCAVDRDATDGVEEISLEDVAVEQSQTEELDPHEEDEEHDVADPDVEEVLLEQDVTADEAADPGSDPAPIEDELKKAEDSSAVQESEDPGAASELPCGTGDVTSEMTNIVASLTGDSRMSISENDAVNSVAEEVVNSFVQDVIAVNSVVENADSTSSAEIAVDTATAAPEIAVEENTTDNRADATCSEGVDEEFAEAVEVKTEAAIETDVVTDGGDLGADDDEGSIVEEKLTTTSSSPVEIVIKQPTPAKDEKSVEDKANSEVTSASASKSTTIAEAATSDMPQIVASLALSAYAGLAATDDRQVPEASTDGEATDFEVQLVAGQTENIVVSKDENTKELEIVKAAKEDEDSTVDKLADVEDDPEVVNILEEAAVDPAGVEPAVEDAMVLVEEESEAVEAVNVEVAEDATKADTTDREIDDESTAEMVKSEEDVDAEVAEDDGELADEEVCEHSEETEVEALVKKVETVEVEGADIDDEKVESVEDSSVEGAEGSGTDQTKDETLEATVNVATAAAPVIESSDVDVAAEGNPTDDETTAAETASVESEVEEVVEESTTVAEEVEDRATGTLEVVEEAATEEEGIRRPQELKAEEGLVEENTAVESGEASSDTAKAAESVAETCADKEVEEVEEEVVESSRSGGWFKNLLYRNKSKPKMAKKTPAPKLFRQDAAATKEEAQDDAAHEDACIQGEDLRDGDRPISVPAQEVSTSGAISDPAIDSSERNDTVMEKAILTESVTADDVSLKVEETKEFSDTDETKVQVSDEATSFDVANVEEVAKETIVLTESEDVVEAADNVVNEEAVEAATDDKAVTDDVARVKDEVSAVVEEAVTAVESKVFAGTKDVESAEEVATTEQTAVPECIAEEVVEPTEAEIAGDSEIETEPEAIDSAKAASVLEAPNEVEFVAVEGDKTSASNAENDIVVATTTAAVAAAVGVAAISTGIANKNDIAEETRIKAETSIFDPVDNEGNNAQSEIKNDTKTADTADAEVVEAAATEVEVEDVAVEAESAAAEPVETEPADATATADTADAEVVEAAVTEVEVEDVAVEAESAAGFKQKSHEVEPALTSHSFSCAEEVSFPIDEPTTMKSVSRFEVDTQPISAVRKLIGRFEMFAKRNAAEAASSRVNSQTNSRANSRTNSRVGSRGNSRVNSCVSSPPPSPKPSPPTSFGNVFETAAKNNEAIEAAEKEASHVGLIDQAVAVENTSSAAGGPTAVSPVPEPTERPALAASSETLGLVVETDEVEVVVDQEMFDGETNGQVDSSTPITIDGLEESAILSGAEVDAEELQVEEATDAAEPDEEIAPVFDAEVADEAGADQTDANVSKEAFLAEEVVAEVPAGTSADVAAEPAEDKGADVAVDEVSTETTNETTEEDAVGIDSTPDAGVAIVASPGRETITTAFEGIEESILSTPAEAPAANERATTDDQANEEDEVAPAEDAEAHEQAAEPTAEVEPVVATADFTTNEAVEAYFSIEDEDASTKHDHIEEDPRKPAPSTKEAPTAPEESEGLQAIRNNQTEEPVPMERKMPSISPEAPAVRTEEAAVTNEATAKATVEMARQATKAVAETSTVAESSPERDSNQLQLHLHTRYEILGVTRANGVIMYHIHTMNRETGERFSHSVPKRYSEFKLLDEQLRLLGVPASQKLPELPKPSVGTLLRGRRSKKTIELREKAFGEFLHYIAQYPELYESAVFQQFIAQ
ncbi:hypothetical protein PHYBOEH_003811 [Phytophthora boehmeriae]|uniref:PX domain-containing protein n=1 Tax=Phytophthora boehmeriae TaxID=109152 RepID=A0A8T1XBX9_9STRA|nr:hypothetical protein PHYBOEH_003811 [Phytophthora boehmeriae]